VENVPLILLTNDDGIYSEGLNAVYRKIKDLGEVIVVAPDSERSAVSHGITLHYPLRVQKVKNNFYSLNGTPADCVILAINKVLKEKPDLVVSGINHGGNLGDDVLYSGTVAGAREASMHDISAFAASLVISSAGENQFGEAAEFCAELAKKILDVGLPEDTFLNVNIPADGFSGVKITRQGNKFAENTIAENQDPRGKKYYWIGQDKIHWEDDNQSDYEAIRKGVISITPLHRDQTHYSVLRLLSNLESVKATSKNKQGKLNSSLSKTKHDKPE
jgi:5'-nucleotidase